MLMRKASKFTLIIMSSSAYQSKPMIIYLLTSLQHHLPVTCNNTETRFIKNVKFCFCNFINNNLSINYHFTECELLFGIPFTNSIDLQSINFLIIFTKWFINRKKTSKLKLYFIEWIGELKVKIDTITLSNTLNDTPNPEWQNYLKEVL